LDISNDNYLIEKEIILDKDVVNNRKMYLVTKRLLDLFGSVIGILILSPVFILIAIFIKFEDPKGPILFKQERVGKDGKKFYMYKFRSMVTDAEDRLKDILEYNEISGAMFKMKDDPRITKIGKFIRKTSIDELPQLFNVLKGDMSLVGPRPPLEREVVQYSTYHYQRLLVTPGCTGLWQVSGRNLLSFDEMILLDLEYIKNRSISKDVLILLRTVKVILKPEGAY